MMDSVMDDVGRIADLLFMEEMIRARRAKRAMEMASMNQSAPDPEGEAIKAEEEDSSIGFIIPTPGGVFEDVVGPNPFYTGRLRQADVLKGALAVTLIHSGFLTVLVNIEMVEVTHSHRPRVAERILRASNHEDVTQIDRPFGGIINIAVAEPSSLRVLRNYISLKEHNTFAFASLAGVATSFSNNGNEACHISIKPFFHSWPRFAAVVKQVCQAESLFFHSWQGGIVFSTCCPHARRPRVTHEKNKICAPIKSGMLRMHEKIPIFDGRRELKLDNYWDERYKEVVKPGATVMILFSIRQTALPDAAQKFEMSGSMTGICLHVLSVIVLAEPSDSFTYDTRPDLGSVHGVESLPRLDDIQLEVGGKRNKRENFTMSTVG